MQADEERTALVVVIDLNPFVWHARSTAGESATLTLSRFLDHLLVFLKAFVMCHQHNRLALVVSALQKT